MNIRCIPSCFPGLHTRRFCTLALGVLALALTPERVTAGECARFEPLPQCFSVEHAPYDSRTFPTFEVGRTVGYNVKNNCNHEVSAYFKSYNNVYTYGISEVELFHYGIHDQKMANMFLVMSPRDVFMRYVQTCIRE